MSSPKILLVDDDRLILSMLGEGLRAAGYETLQASNGEEAITLAEGQHPDLAVLDVRMPGMSGLQVAAHLREKTRVPFIFLSAYGDMDVVSEGVGYGGLVYLVKPVDVAQLIPAIESALVRAQELRALQDTGAQLNTALAASRSTSVAVGLLMERHRISEAQAFERLRSFARSQRRKVQEVAQEIVDASGLLNLEPDRQQQKR